MLDGWYCRSIANEQAAAEEQERIVEEAKLKKQYKFLKTKLKHLLYENECFQSALRSSQKRLLMVTKDRTFLLDRLVLFEKPENSSEDSEDTESSEDEVKPESSKKRKADPASTQNHVTQSTGKTIPAAKKKRPAAPRPPKPPANINSTTSASSAGNTPNANSNIQNTLNNISATAMLNNINNVGLSDGHMTPEEVERHLQSRSFLEIERAPLTVPTELFSNEPSLDLDSESNDVGELETSPSNIGEELSIDMIVE